MASKSNAKSDADSQYTLIMSTWDDGTGQRTEYMKRVQDSLIVKLSPKPAVWIAADDGSPDVHVQTSRFGVISGVHNGIGASLNRAIKQVQTPYFMYTTDDWLLNNFLDIRQALTLLDMGWDYVRLGPIHPNLSCITRFQQGVGWWLQLDIREGGFCFATRPFICNTGWFRVTGEFREGVDSYEVERDYSMRVIHKGGRLAQMGTIPLDGPWEHIGEYAVGERPVLHFDGAAVVQLP